jgi:hypothetical protein
MSCKNLIVAFVFMFVLLFQSESCKAQDNTGDIVVSAGVGYSMNYQVFVPNGGVWIFRNRQSLLNHEYKAHPVLGASVDFSPVDNLSLGVAYSTFNVESKYDYDYYDSLSIEEELKVSNYGVRVFGHFLPNNNKVDIYLGGRIGMNVFNYSNNLTDQQLNNMDSESALLLEKNFNMTPSIHGGFGVSYYIIKWIGINYELMVGTGPYMMRLGANFRLGTAKD